MLLKNNAIGEKLLFVEVTYDAKSVIVSIKLTKRTNQNSFANVLTSKVLEGGNPNARHHGKGLERGTFCHGVELSYCLVTVRALTETWYQECEQTLIILLLSICYRSDFL